MTDHDHESDPLRIAAESLWNDLSGRFGFTIDGGMITSVGMGSKDGEPAIYVYVNRKRDLANVPDTWEGFPVVAKAIGAIRPCRVGGKS